MPTLQKVALTKKGLEEIVETFKDKIASVTTGYTIISVTENGGVSYTGKKTKMPAVFIEITKEKTYVVFALYAYPKGTILHVFDPRAKHAVSVYATNDIIETIKEILLKHTVVKNNGFVAHEFFHYY
jgi:hypothetical protein